MLPRIRVVRGKEIALGPGKVDLLEHIRDTGSIVEAARRMDMSYNRAWLLVQTMNECFKEPLVNAARGGTEGGGTSLSTTGEKLIKLYRKLESDSLKATSATRREIIALIKP